MKQVSVPCATLYLDHAAATRPDPEVLDYFRECALRDYANQEATHGAAYRLRGQLEEAGERLAQAVAGRSMAVHWAMTGTELFGALAALPHRRQGNIVTSGAEHPALAAALWQMDSEVRFLTRQDGELLPGPGCLDERTRLLAVHHVQSETGRITDVDALAATLRREAPQALLLADTIQSAGKLPLPETADFLTVSGHKLGAPGGAALLINPAWKELPLMRQTLQRLRSGEYRFGRPEPALLLTLVFAAELRAERRERELRRVRQVQTAMRRALAELSLPGGGRVVFTVPEEKSSPYILHVRFPGFQGGVLVRMLSEYGVFAASGSACRAESDRPSAALLELGLSREEAYSGVRLSFSAENSPDEAGALREIFEQVLRAY